MITTLLIQQEKYEEAEDISKRALLNHRNQSLTALTALSKLSINDENTIRRKQYLETMSLMQSTIGIGIDTTALSLAKLDPREGRHEEAAKWYYPYVQGLVGADNDTGNVFFSGLEQYELQNKKRNNLPIKKNPWLWMTVFQD